MDQSPHHKKHFIKNPAVMGALASLLMSSGCQTTEPDWQVEPVLVGVAVHGVHGVTFGPEGSLYIGSVMGQSIMRLDVKNGTLSEVIAAPLGEADDIAFGPDGIMAWTALNQGELRIQKPNGTISTVAKDLPFVNPVTFGPEGLLYAATLFGPDRLWAYDLQRDISRIVAENLGGLNAFEFGPDGALYTPLPQQQAVGKIDITTGALTIIAEGVGNIVAVKFHPDGSLYGVSWDDGVLTRIDLESGEFTTVATLRPPLDNLAIDGTGVIYVSRSADNGIISVDVKTGEIRTVMRSDLAAPGGIAWITRHGMRHLVITDIFGYRFFDPSTRTVELLPFDLEGGASSDVDVNKEKIALTYVRRNRVLLKDAVNGKILQTWRDIDTPTGVLIESDGSLLVASYGAGTLIRLSRDEPDRREIVVDGLSGPVDMAWASDKAESTSAVYISDVVAGRVIRLTLATGVLDVIADGLSSPEGLTVLPDGKIGVANVGTKEVILIDPKTGAKKAIATNLAMGGLISRAPAGLGMPTSLIADTDGAIYVVTDANNGLVKLTPR